MSVNKTGRMFDLFKLLAERVKSDSLRVHQI